MTVSKTTLPISLMGYIAAVVSAAIIASILIGGFFALSANSVKMFFGALAFIIPIFLITTCLIGMSAWPGYVAVVYLANRFNFHSVGFYILMGIANVFVAHFLMALLTDFDMDILYSFYPTSLPAGAVGGYVFYRVRRNTLFSNTPNSLHKN